MKNVIVLLLLVLFFFLSSNLFSQVVVQRSHLDGNNIDSYPQDIIMLYPYNMPMLKQWNINGRFGFCLISIQAEFTF